MKTCTFVEPLVSANVESVMRQLYAEVVNVATAAKTTADEIQAPRIPAQAPRSPKSQLLVGHSGVA